MLLGSHVPRDRNAGVTPRMAVTTSQSFWTPQQSWPAALLSLRLPGRACLGGYTARAQCHGAGACFHDACYAQNPVFQDTMVWYHDTLLPSHMCSHWSGTLRRLGSGCWPSSFWPQMSMDHSFAQPGSGSGSVEIPVDLWIT